MLCSSHVVNQVKKVAKFYLSTTDTTGRWTKASSNFKLSACDKTAFEARLLSISDC